MLVRENYLPPPWRPNFGRSREGYGRYAFPVFSRIWVSTGDLGTQSSILLSGAGGRQFCVPWNGRLRQNSLLRLQMRWRGALRAGPSRPEAVAAYEAQQKPETAAEVVGVAENQVGYAFKPLALEQANVPQTSSPQRALRDIFLKCLGVHKNSCPQNLVKPPPPEKGPK